MPKGLILNVDTTKSEFQNPMVELRQGDGNYQSLYVTVTDNGDPFDLTGWTVSFMGTTAGSHKIIDANVVLDSTVVGAFTYTPTKAWGQDEGEFKNAYFKFVKSDETASGASFRVNVLNAVDLTDEEAQDYISVVDAMIDQVKTDMDSKLADTQTTLSNTQSQATIVQSNVDDLNNNVNELKEQNNNLLTSDNDWSGNNTFSKTINASKGINGSLNTRLATFKDISVVTADMITYAGNWMVNSLTVSGIPNMGYLIMEVLPANGNKTAGIIKLSSIEYLRNYIGTVKSGSKLSLVFLPDDSTVVHNTGNETIAGNKTFTGSTTFSSIINGSINGNAATATKATTADLATTAKNADSATTANDPNAVHITSDQTISGNNTFTGTTGMNVLNVSGATTFYTTSITWSTGIMQGKWTIQRIGNWVMAKFDLSSNTSTGTTTLSLPSGLRPLSNFARDLEGGNAGMGPSGTVYISTAYTGNNGMTFTFPTNDTFPTS